MPDSDLFGPLNAGKLSDDYITMTIEEYEAIRLIDLEGMTQEECAESMDVARTTVQRIYNDARRKLAQSLVNAEILKIEGGAYKLCDEDPQNRCCRRRCHRRRGGNDFSDD